MNSPENRARAIVSFGGIGSAKSLAKFYAVLANGGAVDGQRFFSSETLLQMTSTLTTGLDRVFEIPTAFSAGFMKDPPDADRRILAPPGWRLVTRAQAGATPFADPENNLAFAYVMNQMEQQILPNGKSLRLVDAIYTP